MDSQVQMILIAGGLAIITVGIIIIIKLFIAIKELVNGK